MILFGKKKVKPSQKAYAVVTGAGSGIGRSFAIELAKRGGSVVCADINLEAAEETVTLLEQQGAKAFAMRCDVGDAEQVNHLAETAEILFGHPVTLVGTVAKLAMRQPFVLFKGLTFQKLCLP
ncbi:SDR family NAD(P)-dependent oxidoreductase, partial [Acinetobacter baumannii]